SICCAERFVSSTRSTTSWSMTCSTEASYTHFTSVYETARTRAHVSRLIFVPMRNFIAGCSLPTAASHQIPDTCRRAIERLRIVLVAGFLENFRDVNGQRAEFRRVRRGVGEPHVFICSRGPGIDRHAHLVIANVVDAVQNLNFPARV